MLPSCNGIGISSSSMLMLGKESSCSSLYGIVCAIDGTGDGGDGGEYGSVGASDGVGDDGCLGCAG